MIAPRFSHSVTAASLVLLLLAAGAIATVWRPWEVPKAVHPNGMCRVRHNDDAIVCRGTHCTIDRQRVAAILTAPTALADMVRVVPSLACDRSTRFRLYAVRPGSVAARLGLRNGDCIMRVNGNSIASPDDAIRKYREVQHATNVTLDVARNGQLVRFEYAVR